MDCSALGETEKKGDVMIDFIFSLAQFVAFLGLLCGMIVTFTNWRESGHFWGDFDPILGYELQSLKKRWSAAIGPQPLSAADREMVQSFKEAA
jgi:hypothetical protein